MWIIGCDFHSGFQQVAMFDNQSGEMEEKKQPGCPLLAFFWLGWETTNPHRESILPFPSARLCTSRTHS